MDRHTKIRAWLPKTQEMVIPYAYIQGHGWYLSKEDLWSHDITMEESNEKAIYMEPTGLKDKNGTEIYEADLLKHTKTEAIGEVVWYGAEWGIRWEPNSEYPAYNSLQDCWTTLHYEVIGNKFENPELLED